MATPRDRFVAKRKRRLRRRQRVCNFGPPKVCNLRPPPTPLAEESLFSWLQRLATRLQVSFHTLASHSFGVDDPAGRTVWWHRPHPWTLAKIAQRTGVKTTKLRSMTFEDLQSDYRQDEDPARFVGRRYDTRAPDWRAYRLALCGPCMEGDSVPYVRSLWQIGWVAVCPTHGTVLLTRCERCHCGIRVPQLAVCAPFSPTICTRCGESLLAAPYREARPEVIRLQEALLQGKREGVTEVAGLGAFTWPELVALVDIILGAFWTATILEERESIALKYQFESLEAPRTETHFYDCRHDGLVFLAWLIEGWPDSYGASIGREMLWRGLNRPRNRLSHHILPRWKGHPWSPSPHDFAPEIIVRLRKLLEV